MSVVITVGTTDCTEEDGMTEVLEHAVVGVGAPTVPAVIAPLI